MSMPLANLAECGNQPPNGVLSNSSALHNLQPVFQQLAKIEVGMSSQSKLEVAYANIMSSIWNAAKQDASYVAHLSVGKAKPS
jgi:hypothetical protein